MKVLIVKMSSMGDVIHTLPALTDAQLNVPKIELHWIVEEAFAEIPAWHPAVKKVIPIALRRWRKNLFSLLKNCWQFRKELKKEKYDIVIDAQGLIKSAIVASWTKGKKCGQDIKSAREPLAALFYQNRYFIEKDQHAITRTRELFAKALCYQLPDSMPEYNIKNYFENVALEATYQNYLIFLHATARSEKCWPEKNWIELAEKLSKYKILLPWGNEPERERATRIANMASNAEVLNKSNLTKLAKILLGANLIVAVDTGLGHLAAALDVPAISLYGNTDPKLIGTVGNNQIHLASEDKNKDYVDISVTEVFQAISLRLQN
jgi:heptosyltransferase I